MARASNCVTCRRTFSLFLLSTHEGDLIPAHRTHGACESLRSSYSQGVLRVARMTYEQIV